MLSSRQRKVLVKLLQSETYVTIEFLAKWQNVSGRTIRYDLDAIDYALASVDTALKRMPGKGVALHVHEEKRTNLFRIAEMSETEMDKDVQVVMMCLFASMQETVTIQQFADEFYLSRSSVQKQLLDVEETFDSFALQLVKQARKGFIVQGTERSLRSAVFHWLSDKRVDLKRVERWLHVDERLRESIKGWLRSCQEERELHYSETSLRTLFVFLGWWHERIEKSLFVFVPQDDRKTQGFYLGDLEVMLQTELSDQRAFVHECAFLGHLFDQAKVVSYKEHAIKWKNYEKEKAFSTHLIEKISLILDVDLLTDKKLVHDLTFHMKAAFLRMDQESEMDNPYTEEIKVRYRAIYEMVYQITIDMGYTLVAAEVAFITMHLSAGFDRSNSKQFLPTVIVVCASGLATSSIITTKLAQTEPGFHLISIVNTEDLTKVLEESHVDFVLTTQKLAITEWYGTKIFRVSPLLNDEDKRIIQHESQKIINRKQLALFNQFYELSPSVEPTLFDETVYYARTADWKDSIAIAAEPLLNAGYIKQGYIQEMIMSVERNGTYMVFLPRIAFVHAGPENVIKEGISMTIFEEEIHFGLFNPEQVKMVIVMAVKEAHNQDFLQLFRYLESEDVIKKLETKMEWKKGR